MPMTPPNIGMHGAPVTYKERLYDKRDILSQMVKKRGKQYSQLSDY